MSPFLKLSESLRAAVFVLLPLLTGWLNDYLIYGQVIGVVTAIRTEPAWVGAGDSTATRGRRFLLQLH